MTDTGSRIIEALETAWLDIQRRHPEVPNVVMITGTGKAGASQSWGHHWPERWQLAEGGERQPELFASGELLAFGGRRTLQTLIHEAAHALAHVRDIKETSRSGNRYHNKRFAVLAVELGLTAPAQPTDHHGFADCELGDVTATEYAETIARLTEATIAHLPDWTGGLLTSTTGTEEDDEGEGEGKQGAGKGTGAGRAGRRQAAECGCSPKPRRIQLTPKALEDGPVLCGLCGERFEVREIDAA